MLYVSIEDFFEKADSFSKMSRQEEIECAKQMKNGDALARERMIRSYLPSAAGHIKRLSPHLQNLGVAVYCQYALEKAVDSFDFLQDGESFSHHLSWYLRQAVVKYVVRQIDPQAEC